MTVSSRSERPTHVPVSFSPLVRANNEDIVLSTRILPRLLIAEGDLPTHFSIGSVSSGGVSTDCVALICPIASCWTVDLIGGRRIEIGAGDILVVDLLQNSSWVSCGSKSGSRIQVAIIPRSRIVIAFPDDNDVHGRTCKASSWMAGALRTLIAWLMDEPSFDSREDSVDASEAVTAFIVRTLRSSTANSDGRPPIGPTSLLPRIIRFVQLHLGSPSLNAEVLEGQFGISRAALYRLFRPFGGVATFIRERRLMRARSILEDPAYANEPVAAIARSCGFSSLSSFNRAYVARFREPPRAARGKSSPSFVGPLRDGAIAELVNALR